MVHDSGLSEEWIKSHYQEYLQTEHWKDLKRRVHEQMRRRFGFSRCYICRTTDGLQLHHRTYKRVGHEHLKDVGFFCGACHAKVHKRLSSKKSSRTNLWNIAKKMRRAYVLEEKRRHTKNPGKYTLPTI